MNNMHWQYTPYIIPLLITAVIAMTLAFVAWRRRTVGTQAFILSMVIATGWLLGYALELGGADLPTKIFWAKVQYLSITTLPPVWLIFALYFTNRLQWVTRRNLTLLFVIPLITILLVWTNETHGLIWAKTELDITGPFLALKVSYGPWFWVHWLFSYVMLLLATIVLISMLRRQVRLYRHQATLLLFGVLMPWVGNGMYVLGLSPTPLLDLTPFAFTLSGVAIVWGFYRFRLFDILPVARRAIVEIMSDGIIVLDIQNRIIDLNPAAQQIIGSDSVQAIGQQANQLLAKWPDLLNNYNQAMETPIEIATESEPRRYFDARMSPFHNRQGRVDGHLIVLRDITERKRAEETLRESEEKFRTLAETATAAIIIHQGEEFIYVNSAAEFISGYSKAELLNMKFWKIVHPDYRRIIKERGIARLQGDVIPPQYEIKILHKSGQEKWAYLTTGLLEFAGKPAIIATIFDITKLKATETELALARDQALEASRLKTQLLANVSHDLRTPLNAILGYAEMLQMGVYGTLSDRQYKAATEIIDSTVQLLNFVSNLLGQAQIEAGKISLNTIPFTPEQLLEDVSAIAGILAQAKKIKLVQHVAADVPTKLYGDLYWLRQILINLVSNAIKFTEHGSVSVRIYCPDPEHWGIRVSDTGYGIPSEAHGYIFDAFRQVDSTTLRVHGGSGLGLSIVKQLTTLMGGEVKLNSQVGQGSTFIVLLPLTPRSEKQGEISLN